jgi:P4 family phage/plasmid primase-like protien
MDARQVAELCGGAKASAGGWVCRCPAHDDTHNSLSIKDVDGKLVFKCHAGCDQTELARVVLKMAAPLERAAEREKLPAPQQSRIAATYDYTDEHGTLLYQVCRMEPKSFRQRRKPTDADSPEIVKNGWVWSLSGVKMVPYNLAELSRLPMNKAILIVEGEKDVENLRALGVCATTNSSGAGKWRPEFQPYFKNRTVIIVPDNDPAGNNHACDIYESLLGIASRVLVLNLPDLQPKQDVSDWLAAGHSKQDLIAAVVACLGTAQAAPVRQELPRPAPPRVTTIDTVIPPTKTEQVQVPRLPDPKPEKPKPAQLNPTLSDRDNVIQMAEHAVATKKKPWLDPAAMCGPEYSDDAVANEFTAEQADKLRYVSHWNQWYIWDNCRWREDITLETQEFAREHCRTYATMALNDPNIPTLEKKKNAAMFMASSKKFFNVMAVAKADRRHAATTNQWDTDPWLLATPDGTVDLRNGRIKPANPNDHCTKMTRYTPGGDCPTWHKFLASVCCGDENLASYLKRVIGYSLTGVTSEHALFFIFGSGANGKSTFLNTLGHILGDYTAIASMESFVATNNDRHTTELARLRGSRFVAAQETEEGRRWAEAKIKELTGGTPIQARFMRQDFFEFVPQFKLLIAGNHKPTLRNVDEAMRRRLHLIPFTANIPPAERDQQLGEKLLAEANGILQWAIDGCLEWQEHGLNPPESVTEATKEYMQDEDVLGAWLGLACDVSNPQAQTVGNLLYKSFAAYADSQGEFVVSQKRFTQMLENHGLEKKRTGSGIVMVGVSLKNESSGPRNGSMYDD